MATVDLPVVGTVDKKWLWIGGGTAAAVLAWAYYRRSQSGPTVIEEGIEGGVDPGGAGWDNTPGRTGDSNRNEDNDVIDTIPEWTEDVVRKLAATDWDTGFVYATIGKWIAGEGLTDNEVTLVRAAIAASGQPPGGPYPIKRAQPTPTPTPPPPPPPPPSPPPQPPASTGAPHNINLYDWVSGLNRDYPGLNTSFTKLFGNFRGDPTALNPDHRKYMKWLPTTPAKTPVFDPNWSGRQPPLGIPPVRLR